MYSLLWVVTLGYLFSFLAKAPCGWDYGHMPSASGVHRLEGPKIEFQFSKLFFISSKCPIYLKLKSVFHAMALAKRQKAAFLCSDMLTIRHLDFFIRPCGKN
jgi:hypothetical protein